MDRRAFIATLAGGCIAAPRTLHAQPRARRARIGFLAAGSASPRIREPFLQGMRDLGLVDGEDLVDVIVAVSTLCVQAAHHATTTTPIVMVGVPDPVGEGFATSLSRPGGNITGMSNIVTEVSSKHLELLQVAVPRLALVAVLINPGNPSDALILEQVQGTAYTRRIKVLPVEAGTASEIEAGFAGIARARAQALVVATDPFFDVQQELIIRLALAGRLPTISSNREMTEAGGLMCYGQDLSLHYRRAATYVDRILKGAKPGGLPVEQPTVLEFVINRKTAQVLGIAIPRELELRADRVIE
jgi:putative ABC transport system substrate-binding protein